jgi:molybdopterin molybdotransferase
MITTAEATRAVAENMPDFGSTTVPLSQAAGNVLHQTVTAERDQPPFDRVTMDGIAVQFSSLSAGDRRFAIQGTQHAGDPVQSLAGPDQCIEIMTGGVLPIDCDCVIPVERISVSDGTATVDNDYEATRLQFVHPQGSDYPSGHAVLGAGRVITPMDIAIIASSGLDRVSVNQQPMISVISTGNELVPPGHAIESHQVRLSNGPAISSMLRQQCFKDVSELHLVDDKALLRDRLAQVLDESQVMILSGGVSMGKADFVPGVLADLGVEVVFHKISQRPGKPMWFGIGPRQQAVFALPGNPVSTLVCCRQYVLPALFQASGRARLAAETAILAEDIIFKPRLTCFMPARIAAESSGQISATPVSTNTSGDFAALSGTDGYIELALEQDKFDAGTVLPLHRWTAP